MSWATSRISRGRNLRPHAAAVAMAAIVGARFLSGAAVVAAPQQPPPASACIAIVTPSVQGIEGNVADFGSSVRDLFASYLTGPTIQVMQLQARLASQAMEEAKQQQCDHVLTATLTRKHGGSAFGTIVGQAAGSASWAIPGGGTATSAVARGVAIGTAQAVASVASTTRAKDEIRLDYRVSTTAGAVIVGPRTEKLKAKVDGEDLLTPLVARASESIAAAIVK